MCSTAAMASIVDPDIELYLRHLYDDGDPVRLEMEEVAKERNFPIPGHLFNDSIDCGRNSINNAALQNPGVS